MWNYIKAHPVNVALSALFILAFASSTFLLLSLNKELSEQNRAYKDNIKTLEEINARAQVSIDSLKKSVSVRTAQDSLLKVQIAQLPITTTNANHRTIINMPVDSFMLLFSAYIDSAGKAVN